MTDTALLTAQDIGEAEGAMTALLEGTLAPSGRSRAEYITLRVLAARPPFRSAAELGDFLASQRQLGLDRGEVVTMLDGLVAEGLVAVTPAGAALTADGRAVLEELTGAVAPVTRQVFAGLDRNDLAVAHHILVELIRRARTMTTAA